MTQQQNEIPSEKQPVSIWVRLIGSGFLTGYAPYATGTVGSAAGLAFFFIPEFQNPFYLLPATIILFVVGAKAAEALERQYGQDPGIVTVDEIVGMWISLWFIEPTLMNLGVAFLIFRILDILKPYPAGIFDSKKGGWNIMLDDVIAGIYTNIIIQIALRWL